MKKLKSILAATAAAALAACAAQAASATTYIESLGLLTTPNLTLPFAGNPAPTGGDGNAYQFDFSTSSAWYAIFQMQVSEFFTQQTNNDPEPIQFELDQLTTHGTYVPIDISEYTTGSDVARSGKVLLEPGTYRLLTDQIGLPKGDPGILSGAIELAAVPEPATWAMLLLGSGLIGLAARRRRNGAAVAA